jgi:hypothetical protein
MLLLLIFYKFLFLVVLPPGKQAALPIAQPLNYIDARPIKVFQKLTNLQQCHQGKRDGPRKIVGILVRMCQRLQKMKLRF